MTDRSLTPPEMPASDRLANLIKHHGSTHLMKSDSGALISDYAPQMVMPRWVDIHDFTHRCVEEMATSRDESDRQAYLSVTSRLVHWATGYGSSAEPWAAASCCRQPGSRINARKPSCNCSQLASRPRAVLRTSSD